MLSENLITRWRKEAVMRVKDGARSLLYVNLFLKEENWGRNGVECSFIQAQSVLVKGCYSLARRARDMKRARRPGDLYTEGQEECQNENGRDDVNKSNFFKLLWFDLKIWHNTQKSMYLIIFFETFRF